MDATLVVRRRVVYGDRDFAELVVWRVPFPVPPSTHNLNYRLVYIVDGTRVVGFNNERGKGDHVHRDGKESSYDFRSVDRLLADFVSAVEDWRTAHGKD